MTTYKQYRCNLCQDFILPTDSTTREGFGVHFFRHSPAPGQPWLGFKRASECEKHICHLCAKAVSDELRKVTPADRPEPVTGSPPPALIGHGYCNVAPMCDKWCGLARCISSAASQSLPPFRAEVRIEGQL